MIQNSIDIRNDTGIFRFLDSSDQFFFRSPVSSDSAFLVEFAEIVQIVDIVTYAVLSRGFSRGC